MRSPSSGLPSRNQITRLDLCERYHARHNGTTPTLYDLQPDCRQHHPLCACLGVHELLDLGVRLQNLSLARTMRLFLCVQRTSATHPH